MSADGWKDFARAVDAARTFAEAFGGNYVLAIFGLWFFFWAAVKVAPVFFEHRRKLLSANQKHEIKLLEMQQRYGNRPGKGKQDKKGGGV